MEIADLRALERATRYGPPVANFILAVLIGIALAHLVWLVVPSPAGNARPGPRRNPGVTASHKASGPSLATIKQANLFGVAAPQGRPAPVHAPETHLNLTLDGVVAWDDPKLSQALIRGPSHKEDHYAVGDKVPGGASISAIYPDRVILKRGGGYETLRLERKTLTGSQSGQQDNGNGAGLDADIRNHDFGAARDQLLQNPDKISQVMRLQPAYRNGQLEGYRVYPGNKRQLFLDLGLRPGDLVKSINGVKLSNSHNALSLLKQLRQARQLNVTVNRLGKTENLTLSLQ